jgi:8-oxo-dGTP diphosphatase
MRVSQLKKIGYSRGCEPRQAFQCVRPRTLQRKSLRGLQLARQGAHVNIWLREWRTRGLRSTRMNAERPSTKVIRIVAALIQDEAWRVLLVRKKGTRAFMQPGGKLHDSESHLAALERELAEELSCSIRPGSPVFLGTFTAPAANESGCDVTATLYRVELEGTISAASEIEEIAWIDPHPPYQIELAPLTRDAVLPLVTHTIRRSTSA